MSEKEKKEKVPEEKVENKPEKGTDEVEKLKKECEEWKKKFQTAEENFEKADKEKEEWKNRYYETYADISNLRKQVQRENDDFKKYASQSLVEELIPTLDSFDMAVKNKPTDSALSNYFEGFNMIHKKLLYTLKQLSVVIIDPEIGSEYNPHEMQAYSTIDGEEDNKVAEVFTKGYRLHDHLLRPAGVIVTQKKQEEKKEEKASNDSKEESK